MAEESIYDLIPQPVIPQQIAPMYRSKHDGKLAPTFSSFAIAGTSKPGYTNVAGSTMPVQEGHHEYKKGFATMGKEGNANAPSALLKKSTGGGGGAGDAVTYAPTGSFAYGESRRPAVPTKGECLAATKALKKTVEPKNFITTNAVENILAVPKKPEEEADWLKKPHFGKVPPYLNKIKKEIADEYEYIRSMQQMQEEAAPEGMRLMGEEERLMLINDLKTKWGEINGYYQSTSVLSLASLDTIGKVKRKEMFEAQLAQIEKDIEKLTKKNVYVRDDM